MKNAMKKLMAFALAAVMLIGTLPFAAFATEETNNATRPTGVTMIVKVDGSEVASGVDISNCIHTNGVVNTAAVQEKATAYLTDASRDYTFTGITGKSGNALAENKVKDNWEVVANFTSSEKAVSCPNCNNSYYPSQGHSCYCNTCGFAYSADHACSVCEDCGYIIKSGGHECPVCDKCGYVNAATGHICPVTPGSNDSGNSGSSTTTPDDNDDDTQPVSYSTVKVYVVGEDTVKTKYYYTDVTVGRVVQDFDTADTSKHYALSYFTINGGESDDDDYEIIKTGDTAKIYLKVTESKLNDNKVYLQIYLNNNFDTPAKTLNVTTMASEDGLNLYGNVEDLILDNYTAKNSKGLKMDGMYEAVGSWVSDFLEDDKVSKVSADEVVAAKEKTFVVYNIMVTNAKTSSSGTADDTNPKTGDQIMVPVAIMAVSASVLAAVAFYLNKKRVY